MSSWLKLRCSDRQFDAGYLWVRSDAVTAVQDHIRGAEAVVVVNGAKFIADHSAEAIFKEIERQCRFGSDSIIEMLGTYDMPKDKGETEGG